MSLSNYKINTTSNIEKLFPNLALLQRQFQHNYKLSLTEYANNARIELNKNIKIKEHISRLKYINYLFRKLLIDIMQKKGNKIEINNLLEKFNKIFKEDNIILKNEKKEIQEKYIKYQAILDNEIKSLKQQLTQLKKLNFILENRIIYKDNLIARYKYSFYMAYNNPYKNNEIESFIQSDIKSFDCYLEDISRLYQDILMKSLKEINKIKDKNIDKSKKIEYLKKILNNKEEIKNSVSKEKNKNIILNKDNDENSFSSFKEFELMPSITTLENIEKNLEEDGAKIKADIYNLPQKNLIKSSINQIFIKNGIKNINKIHRIHSFENKNNKKLLFNSINEKELPKLNLRQINFNKDNKRYELSSNFERGIVLSKSSSTKKKVNNSEIKKRQKRILKNKIKKTKCNIRKNQKLIKKFKKFYSIISNKYDKYIYEPFIELYVLSTQNKNDD